MNIYIQTSQFVKYTDSSLFIFSNVRTNNTQKFISIRYLPATSHFHSNNKLFYKTTSFYLPYLQVTFAIWQREKPCEDLLEVFIGNTASYLLVTAPTVSMNIKVCNGKCSCFFVIRLLFYF